jgi:hypothetical protein
MAAGFRRSRALEYKLCSSRFGRFPTADVEIQTCLAASRHYSSCRRLCREGGFSSRGGDCANRP